MRGATLPQFQSNDKDFQMLQNTWATFLNPVLRNTILRGTQLTGIALVSGNNSIATTLGRKYQGYIITGMRGAFAQVYEVPGTMPESFLILNSNGACTVDLWVY